MSGMIVKYVNHASVLVQSGNTTIIIDPFLSGKFFLAWVLGSTNIEI